MTKVYFEKGGYAEHIATFKSEELYAQLVPALEKLALDNGFDKVTESVEQECLANASYYLSDTEAKIEEQVNAIANHPNQHDLIDSIECVTPCHFIEGMYSCEKFLDLIGY